MENKEKRTQFWGADKEDDTLIKQILSGVKKATACPKCQSGPDENDPYYDGPFDVDDLVTVYDGTCKKRCVIRITESYECMMSDIPEKLWRGEGVYSNADQFREDHIKCWKDETEFDSTDENLELVCWHFELVRVF